MSEIPTNYHWLETQAINNPESLAVQTEYEKVTYSQLLILSKQAAISFQKKGVKKGCHVSVLSENSIEFIIIINAFWFLGAIPIPINTRLNQTEIQSLLAHSGSEYLIVVGSNSEIASSRKITVLHFSIEEIKKNQSTLSLEELFPENIAVMIYSSGSTGEPKLVQLSFKNLFLSFNSSNEFIKHTQNDCWLASLPFYHIGGFSMITRSLLSGCSIAILDSTENGLFESFRKFKPSLISLVPTMIQNILASSINPWEGLRFAFIGGGPISSNIVDKAIESNWPVALVYGSTETSSMVTICTKENYIKNGFSGGIPFDGVELKIIDNDGLELPQNQVGEIVISSKSIAKSYYKSNVNKITNNLYYSNDLGRIDDKGNLHIIGRKDDVIISGGENISLNEIKNMVQEKFNFDDLIALELKIPNGDKVMCCLFNMKKVNKSDKRYKNI